MVSIGSGARGSGRTETAHTLIGAASERGHSISSHSSGRGVDRGSSKAAVVGHPSGTHSRSAAGLKRPGLARHASLQRPLIPSLRTAPGALPARTSESGH